MDPNETLRRIRALTRQDTYPIELDAAWDELTEAFNDLDSWLIRAGFLPDDWAGGL